MPKVEIWYDERYPDYGLGLVDEKSKLGGNVAEISDAELAEYEHVSELYENMQAKLVEWSNRK